MDLGIQAGTAENDRKHIRLTNLLAAVVMGMNLVWVAVAVAWGEHAAIALFAGNAALLAGPLFLNRRGAHYAAAVVYLIGATVSLVLSIGAFGIEA